MRTNNVAPLCLCASIIFVLLAATSNSALATNQLNLAPQRIISLSPHLSEIVFALGKGHKLVAVSDYSDYPKQALTLPSVASYEGANIADILRLAPTHVLVWRGGNKDADIEKLRSLNLSVYESHIDSIETLLSDIESIGEFIGASSNAKTLIENLKTHKNEITQHYKGRLVSAIYYLSTQPLVGLGNDKWLNSVLALCGINNIYANSMSAFPQLQLADIIRQQPDIIIAATSASPNTIDGFWSAHRQVLNSNIVNANPDALHRFTPRVLSEMKRLCKSVYN